MQSLKRVLNSIFLILTFFLAMPVWAGGVFITDINGKTSDFEIKRGGKSIKFAHFTRLQAGDKVRVLTRANDPHDGRFEGKPYSITLSINGRMKMLTQQNPYYLVTKHDIGIPGSVSTGVLHKVSNWFRSLWVDDVITVSIQTKGDEEESQITLSIPLLEGGIKQLEAGKRKLHLAWYGGKGPFKVTVYKDRRLLLHQTSEAREIVLNQLTLVVGQNYQVQITDAKEQSTKGTFTVVDNLQQILSSAEAQAIKQSGLPSKRQQNLLTAWLAIHEDGKWKFEAYQMVANATRKTNPSDFLIKQGLRVGL
jgi:hypothetical protein